MNDLTQLTEAQRTELKVHESKLNDHTLSPDEHAVSRRAIDAILGHGEAGLVSTLVGRIDRIEATLADILAAVSPDATKPACQEKLAEKPKRKRGRPRKNASQNAEKSDTKAESVADNDTTVDEPDQPANPPTNAADWLNEIE